MVITAVKQTIKVRNAVGIPALSKAMGERVAPLSLPGTAGIILQVTIPL
jgi:hypothetical protein